MTQRQEHFFIIYLAVKHEIARIDATDLISDRRAGWIAEFLGHRKDTLNRYHIPLKHGSVRRFPNTYAH